MARREEFRKSREEDRMKRDMERAADVERRRYELRMVASSSPLFPIPPVSHPFVKVLIR